MVDDPELSRVNCWFVIVRIFRCHRSASSTSVKCFQRGLIVLSLPIGFALFGAVPASANSTMCRSRRGGDADKLLRCNVQY